MTSRFQRVPRVPEVPRVAMLIKRAADIRESEVTPKELFVRRREFIAAAGVTAAAVATGGLGPAGRRGGGGAEPERAEARQPQEEPVQHRRKAQLLQGRHHLQQLLRVRHSTRTIREVRAARCSPRPWSVVVEGAVRQARHLQHRRHHEVRAARRAHLSPALRRSVVDGRAVGRLSR